MRYKVDLTQSALIDLNDILDWISGNDSPERALDVLDKIEIRLDSLSRHPERGAVAPELREIGIDKYREVFFKPYRIIYQVVEERVIVNLIADGRRDMFALLQRRLTSP
jgi:toxin ParE1/3/4